MGFTKSKLAIAAIAVVACGGALATEDYDLRYAPGIGGADMSAPFEGGWVFQAPAYIYSGKVKSSSTSETDLTAPPFNFPVPGAAATTTVDSSTVLSVQGLLPRLSYMSQEKFLGAQLGATALLPLLNKKSSVSIKGVNTTTVNTPPPYDEIFAGAIDVGAGAIAGSLAAANSNARFGIGDFEISPIMRWATDTSQVLFITTLVLPTGDYKATRASNPGAGDFYTLRPAVQYSYIGNGWDFGGRAAFSMNTTNKQSHYKSGNYLNIDTSLMKSLDDSTRVGLAGYGVVQTTRDSMDGDPVDAAAAARQAPTLGEKGHVFGIGPSIAYIKGAGEYLVEARVMKEFAADNRPQGATFFATLSKPF
jgi:hypothetical protein